MFLFEKINCRAMQIPVIRRVFLHKTLKNNYTSGGGDSIPKSMDERLNFSNIK